MWIKIDKVKRIQWFINIRKTYMVSEVKWTKYWNRKRNKENGKSEHAVHSGPQNGLDWRCRLTPEIQRLEGGGWTLDRHGALPHQNADTKMKFVTLWAGKEARTYLNILEQDHHDSLKAILDSLEEWTRPKSDEIAAFTHLRTLNQGNKTLSSHIQEVRRVVDLCNFVCVGDCKDRLIRNSIVGWSLKYQSLPAMHIERLQSNIEWMYQNMPNRGCNSKTSASPLTRVHRLHRYYTQTSHEWIPSSAPQDKPQGQRRL